MSHGNHSVEYDFGISASEGDHNPTLTFVLDIDYDYTPEQPVRLHPWPGEPGHGAEVDMSADLFLLESTVRLPMPPEVKSWLLARIDLKQFVEEIIEKELDDREAARDAAEEARAERRNGVDA